MNTHHDTTTCPAGAHVHPHGPVWVLKNNWLVMLDHRVLAVCTTPTAAERIAELLNDHGLLAIPDHLPTSWAPPHPEDRFIDWNLPADPTIGAQ